MKGTTDFLRALDEIEREKGVSKEIIFDSLEKALLKSYEKNFREHENVKININRTNGKVELFAVKTVVEVVEDVYKRQNVCRYWIWKYQFKTGYI